VASLVELKASRDRLSLYLVGLSTTAQESCISRLLDFEVYDKKSKRWRLLLFLCELSFP
jgi:hypothetical protein